MNANFVKISVAMCVRMLLISTFLIGTTYKSFGQAYPFDQLPGSIITDIDPATSLPGSCSSLLNFPGDETTDKFNKCVKELKSALYQHDLEAARVVKSFELLFQLVVPFAMSGRGAQLAKCFRPIPVEKIAGKQCYTYFPPNAAEHASRRYLFKVHLFDFIQKNSNLPELNNDQFDFIINNFNDDFRGVTQQINKNISTEKISCNAINADIKGGMQSAIIISLSNIRTMLEIINHSNYELQYCD